VSNVDDAKEYLETRNAMDIVGISQEEQVIGSVHNAPQFNETVISLYPNNWSNKISLHRMLSSVW